MLLDRLRRVPPWGWAVIFSLAICLPRLGAFGFWDPWELKIADQAREMAENGHLLDPTVGGRYPAGKPLGLFLAALGIKIFGAGEFGARLPGTLCALGTLMAVYWAAAGMFRRRAALLSTLALGSMTIFTLESRQLTSDAPAMLGLTLAMGGLGRYAWPASGRRRITDFLIGGAGLLIGYLATGALTGVVLPGLALLAALIVGYGLVASDDKVDDGTGDLAAPGTGPDIPAGSRFGDCTLRLKNPAGILLIGLGVVCVALMVIAMTNLVASKYSALLGGVAQGGVPSHNFEYLIRQLGFGLFPCRRAYARTRAWPSGSCTSSSSPAWASRCRPTWCWCWATGAISRCRPSAWRWACSWTKRWRATGPNRWPAC